MNPSMTNEEKIARCRLVARLAAAHYDTLSNDARIELMEGLALILPEKEAEAAAQTAFTLRKAQEYQLAFRDLLNTPKQ